MDFVAGIFFSFWFLVPALLFFVLAETNDRGFWSFVLGAAILWSSWQYIAPFFQLWHLALYVPIGIVWSIWRFDRRCSKITAELKKENEKAHWTTNYSRSDMHPRNNVDRITRWIIFWPLSVVQYALNDALSAVTGLVKGWLQHIYAVIENRHLEKLDKNN